jgi:hypothetical protein
MSTDQIPTRRATRRRAGIVVGCIIAVILKIACSSSTGKMGSPSLARGASTWDADRRVGARSSACSDDSGRRACTVHFPRRTRWRTRRVRRRSVLGSEKCSWEIRWVNQWEVNERGTLWFVRKPANDACRPKTVSVVVVKMKMSLTQPWMLFALVTM